jgi:hypothetical protein
MRYFPQLSTGAICQLPFSRRRVTRTVRLEADDGHSFKSGDPDAELIVWEIDEADLDDGEWSAIQSLFHDCEGRLGRFTFLDPADNLLRHSENLKEEAWNVPAGILLTPGAEDPHGGTNATLLMNSSQSVQGPGQFLAAPGGFQYCLSVFLRGTEGDQCVLVQSAGGLQARRAVGVGSAWRRVFAAGQLGTGEDGVSFGIELAPGQAAEVFGFQVEAQPMPSGYKRTTTRSGVHLNACFLDDTLRQVTQRDRQHATRLRIGASVERP